MNTTTRCITVITVTAAAALALGVAPAQAVEHTTPDSLVGPSDGPVAASTVTTAGSSSAVRAASTATSLDDYLVTAGGRTIFVNTDLAGGTRREPPDAPSAVRARPAPVGPDVQAARVATARYHSLKQATKAGYGELRDAAGIACIDNPAGGMGIHYVNGDLVGDVGLDPTRPEVLVYEPQPGGSMKLVALEYVVLESTWRASHPDPNDLPTLYGQTFERLPGPDEDEPQNRYGLPAFYELHVWAWRDNPSGMFEDWNPTVTCP